MCISALAFCLTLPGFMLASPPARRTAGGRVGPQAAASDNEIEKAIRGRLAASRISSDHFTVRVQGGVAVLEGQTGVIQHKGTATRLAKSAGALRVDNRIQISQEARQKAAANLTQGRRRAQIKRSETSPRSERDSGRKN